jgi:2-C-methyl-D-erythritol 4-phosphate cytidylyltransferase
LGQTVAVVQGRWDNIKVTTAEDLTMAEAILNVRVAAIPGCNIGA